MKKFGGFKMRRILCFLMVTSFLFTLVMSSYAVEPYAEDVNESQVQKTFYVDKANVNADDKKEGIETTPFKSINAAILKASKDLSKGIPCKIVVAPGTYREQIKMDGLLYETFRRTPLIIEGSEKGKVIISGSEEYPASTWKKVAGLDNVYSHTWNQNFGFYDGKWGQFNPSNIKAHRREMIFFNGKMLKQIQIEKYSYAPTFLYEGQGLWSYEGYLGPKILTEGSFGVSQLGPGEADYDKHADPNTIFIKLTKGMSMTNAKIEVATRENLLNIGSKDNLVIRNIVFEHAASKFDQSAIKIGRDLWQFDENYHNKNILIDNCEVRYNNANGFSSEGTKNLSIRNTKIHHNGENGIMSAYVAYSVWEDDEVSDNGWRIELGGGYMWAGAGVKLNWCSRDMVIRRFNCFRNAGQAGFWTDGNSFRLSFEDCNFSNNTENGLLLEISEGPNYVTNCVMKNNNVFGFKTVESRNTILQSCEIGNNKKSQIGIEFKNDGRMNVIPSYYMGPDFQNPCKGGTTEIYACKIYENDGSGAYLYTGERYSEEPGYGNLFINKLKADRNKYYTTKNKTPFVTEFNHWAITAQEDFEGWKKRLSSSETKQEEDQEQNSEWVYDNNPITPSDYPPMQPESESDEEIIKTTLPSISKDLAYGKKVKVNNNFYELSFAGPSKLVDGIENYSKENQGYFSDPGKLNPNTNLSIEIDLQKNTALNQVVLYPVTYGIKKNGDSPDFPLDFTIQVKKDNGKYVTVKNIKNHANPKGKPQAYNFSDQTARYVKINITKLGFLNIMQSSSKYRFSFTEVAIYKK